ncbi:MAG: serine protease inhibitor ecotin [Gammaproteobacteria bacterium]|nr:serine protease inhibitor ecotin [Gammaproteobacteria bacterium]MDH5619211.1 serine protease inhibitor ecotin [Gammaproteobacteria bacterium]
MRPFYLLMPVFLIGACASAMTQNDDLQAWPAAGTGEIRYVIRLPKKVDEDAHAVELVVGRELEVDCNRHWFGGKLERAVVSGWGYPLYRVSSVAGPASTRMACPDEEKRTEFVAVHFEDSMLRYNSKLPIVVYVPDGFSVRYRTWSADAEAREATAE